MSALRKNTSTHATASSATSTKATRARDLVWGRPVFKAPTLPNPRTIFDPLPFTATRISGFGSDRGANL